MILLTVGLIAVSGSVWSSLDVLCMLIETSMAENLMSSAAATPYFKEEALTLPSNISPAKDTRRLV